MSYKRYLRKYKLTDSKEAYTAYIMSDKRLNEEAKRLIAELTYPIRFGCKQKYRGIKYWFICPF